MNQKISPRQLKRAIRNPRRAARSLGTITRHIIQGSSSPSSTIPLAPAEALRQNGFTIYRGLFPAGECARLAAEFKQDAGIEDGVHFTRTDATNKVPSTRQVLFDERLLTAVREAVRGDIRFLQISDLHYLHDTASWHRDSVHRAQDNSDAPDWRDDQGEYAIVKAILYLESDNAAMGIMAGSNLSPIAIDSGYVKLAELLRRQLVIDVDDELNRELSATEKRLPLAWKAQAGDVLVFDERMYHAGRRVENGKVTWRRDAAKFTLSLVFGLDNMHSDRFYSYFRYARRELGYHDFPPDFREQLKVRDLILSAGLGNYYEQHPQELRLASLRRPETMEPLIEEFARAGQAAADTGG